MKSAYAEPTPAEQDAHDEWYEELRRQRWRRRYADRLRRHPDCRDPDHPGCERCLDTEEERDG